MPLLLLMLSSVLWYDSACGWAPTYQHDDPSSGVTLTCAKCPPGMHMVEHCTATTPTQCGPCREDHFTELWNYLPRCLYCNNFCSENQEVETECSAKQNRVCRCKEGFYWSNAFCVRHTECGPGSGVHTKGTPKADTVCEGCAEGYFSSSNSPLDPCVRHQQCAVGQVTFLNGSSEQDTVCGTSEDFAKGGETFRTFLSTFFSTHRMRLFKMKRFVARNIHKSREETYTRPSKQRGPLMDEIKTWLSEAPVDTLKKLPIMLKALQLNTMSEKLEKAFYKIQEQDPNSASD